MNICSFELKKETEWDWTSEKDLFQLKWFGKTLWKGTAFDLGLVRCKWLGHERGGGGGGGKAFKKEVSAGAKAGTPGDSICFHVAAVQGTWIVWWQIKEGLECQSKVCGFYSEARGRQWSDMSRALLQEDKSVTNFKMFWSEEKLLWGGECS